MLTLTPNLNIVWIGSPQETGRHETTAMQLQQLSVSSKSTTPEGLLRVIEGDIIHLVLYCEGVSIDDWTLLQAHETDMLVAALDPEAPSRRERNLLSELGMKGVVKIRTEDLGFLVAAVREYKNIPSPIEEVREAM